MILLFFTIVLLSLILNRKPDEEHHPDKTCSGKNEGCIYCSSWNAPLCPYHDKKKRNKPVRYVNIFPGYEFGSDGSMWSLSYNRTGQRKQLKPIYKKDKHYFCYLLMKQRKRKQIIIHVALQRYFPEEGEK
jgi:hypothetical protein